MIENAPRCTTDKGKNKGQKLAGGARLVGANALSDLLAFSPSSLRTLSLHYNSALAAYGGLRSLVTLPAATVSHCWRTNGGRYLYEWTRLPEP